MPCYHPIPVWLLPNVKSKNGKASISFKDPYAKPSKDRVPLLLPCGRCVGCRLSRSRQWAVRCVHEASLYENNCFITLTFSPLFENLNNSLMKTDFQNFMKRLRKKFVPKIPNGLDQKQKEEWLRIHGIRFFHCGEYGTKGERPHHHACLFNFDFPDKELWSVKNGVRLYRSEILERLWSVRVTEEKAEYFDDKDLFIEDGKIYAKQGFCTIGDVTPDSAAYVAGYMLKKIKEDDFSWLAPPEDDKPDLRIPEYISMSRRPGIGKGFMDQWASDIYPEDELVFGGLKLKPPRYYDNLYAVSFPEDIEKIKENRLTSAKENPHNSDIRLRVREKIAVAKLKTKKRTFEE